MSYRSRRVGIASGSEAQVLCNNEPIERSFQLTTNPLAISSSYVAVEPLSDIQSKVDKLRVHSAPFINFEFATNN